MNKEQAQRACELGKAALAQGNTDKAVRMLSKSISLFPTEEAAALLKRAKSSATEAAAKEGLRKRQETAKKRVSEPQRDTRPYTAEQVSAVRRIKNCKDLYQMLGVPRNADGAAIKKAYRKLALKFHPDKNSAPGADEAFKDINKAFSVLSDAQKRAAYDQYGDSSDNPAQGFTRRYHEDDFDPADIFREVFGAGFAPMGGNVRTFHFGPGGFRTQGRAGHAADRSTGLLQLLPLLFLFLMSFTSLPQTQEAAFSLTQTSRHPIERKTVTSGIIPEIPFFVDQQFRRVYARDYRKLQSLEAQVQSQYIRYVDNKCRTDRVSQKRRAERARQQGRKADYETMLSKELASCKEWERINTFIRS